MPQGNQMDIKTLSLSVAAVAANSRKSFFRKKHYCTFLCGFLFVE
jgi:hypothetical protein